jgi:hypothetical protein
MLKKATEPALPHGRGSVSACKHVGAIQSRARQQSLLGFFSILLGPAAQTNQSGA